MATTYGTRWTVTFKDRNQVTRIIYIKQAGWSGDVTEVIPGKNPLVVEEDNSDDLNKRVRSTTGRLEVVEENFGDLSDMFPQWSTQIMVECSGMFFGYIKAQNSSNAWEAGPRTLKFNLVSPLALAYDIPMPINTTMGIREVGSVMNDLLTTLNYESIIMPIGNLTSSTRGDFFRGSIRGMLICPYDDKKAYKYPNNNSVFAPISCGELLEAICVKHDLICHDLPFSASWVLLFRRISGGGTYYKWETSYIGSGNYDSGIVIGNDTLRRSMAADFTIADDSNSEQLVRPYSMVTVNHEGDLGENQVMAPTWQSEYVPNSLNNLLRPRGIWLNIADQNILMRGESMAKPETTGSDYDDYEVVDELDINTQYAYADKTLLFSVTFYNVDPSKLYRFKFAYQKSDEVINTGFWITARGKSGWYYPGMGGTYHPIAQTEQFETCGLNSDTNSHERTANFYMLADEWITINVYSESGLKAVKVWDMRLEGKPYAVTAFSDKYEAIPYAEQLVGNNGSKELTIEQMLNTTFFSNYYTSNLTFNSPYLQNYILFLSSQRRLRVKVRGTFDLSWFFYKYYINDQNELWRLIAITRDVRDGSYTLTFHHSQLF